MCGGVRGSDKAIGWCWVSLPHCTFYKDSHWTWKFRDPPISASPAEELPIHTPPSLAFKCGFWGSNSVSSLTELLSRLCWPLSLWFLLRKLKERKQCSCQNNLSKFTNTQPLPAISGEFLCFVLPFPIFPLLGSFLFFFQRNLNLICIMTIDCCGCNG